MKDDKDLKVTMTLGELNLFAKYLQEDEQPKRKWVGLTYKDITRLQDEYTTEWGAYTVDFIKAVEAKLKEKNT